MPLKLNVGTSQKVGLPKYGSAGATCAVEVELDSALLVHDPAALHARIDDAFALCRQAVEAELARQSICDPGESTASCPCSVEDAQFSSIQRGDLRASCARAITERQVQAIEGIAVRQQIDLAVLLNLRLGKQRLTDLTRAEASRLISELQAVDSGRSLAS